MPPDPSPRQSFPASMRCAFSGLGELVAGERNARIHLVATLVAVAAGLGLGLSGAEWCWMVLAIAAIWTAEALNTAIEKLGDAVSPGHHALVGSAKDVAAAGVLVAVTGAAVIGLLVLGPHMLEVVNDV